MFRVTGVSVTTGLLFEIACVLVSFRTLLLSLSTLPIFLEAQSLLITLEKLSLLSSSKPFVTLFLGRLATGISLLESSSSFLNLLLAVLVFATFSILGAYVEASALGGCLKLGLTAGECGRDRERAGVASGGVIAGETDVRAGLNPGLKPRPRGKAGEAGLSGREG